MKKFALPLLIASLTLVGCKSTTASVTNDDAMEQSSTAAEDTMVADDAMAEDNDFTGAHSEIDSSKSSITFMGKSNIVNHEGHFETFDVVLDLDESDPSNLESASLLVMIDPSSIKSDPGLEDHLKKTEFFDVENYPDIAFESTKIMSMGGDRYDITGDMTIKGITKPATFTATITDDGVVAQYDLPRKDFGIGNDSYGDKLLEEVVPVDVNLAFVQ